MIIIKLSGGLGNQMFQYATGKRLSIKNNTELKLDNAEYRVNNYRTYGLNNFNIIENFATEEEVRRVKKSGIGKLVDKLKPYYKKSVIKYKGYDFDHNILKLSGNFYLDGYWQSEKYFKEIENIIRKEITLKESLPSKYSELINEIKKSNSISVHVRRGDYVTNKKFSKVYNLLDEKYYQRGRKLYCRKNKQPSIFYLF